ncbi:MAG TPA: MFS transporter [Roseiflexaceae bacterium]|nr:MFS transporter [Roseiflexaceae bacterium]
MKLKTFVVLFICHAVPLFIGMGLFPLLPLYAARFGATHTDIGIFYAVVYIASAASVLGTGWLAARVPRRRLFLIGAALGMPSMLLLGNATALWQVVLLTALAWISGGITLTLLSIFTGQLADPARRGWVFSMMSLVYPLDALVGGAVVGRLTAAYGYTTMFYGLAAVWIIQPLVGALWLRVPNASAAPAKAATLLATAPFGRPFMQLLVASLLSIASISIGRLGTSLSMEVLGFAPEIVASTAIISGLATIPLTLLVGTLADRFGRRQILLVSYLGAAAGAATLIAASAAWQFQIAATLLLAAWCVNRAASSALGTDLLPPEGLGRGLPRLASMDSIASIVGFAISGFVIDSFGGGALYGLSATLALAAVVVLVGLPRRRRAVQPGLLVMEQNGVVISAGPSEAR